ncbi:MAG: polysaccharide deacetylase family protein [Alphaproteobacteria bacterium]|nr:polysaccharide deacetylase family protein [Alphaproteobacteria bacterium]
MRRVSFAARLVREFGGLLATRPASVDWPGGVVSFTFDDFPRSAWTEGGPVLEAHRVRGTYYTAMGFAGGGNHLGPMFELDDLRAAHARGHEIACHTFSHRDCMRAPAGEIAAEIERNGAALVEALDGMRPGNFAYPFGGVSQSAKAAAHLRFDTCRGTGRGINRGIVDLADLAANSIYTRDFDRALLCRLIDDAQARGGWVIFFTHDVTDAPSAFGCTPAQLDAVVAYAVANTAVLPVHDVLARLGLAAAAAVTAAA